MIEFEGSTPTPSPCRRYRPGHRLSRSIFMTEADYYRGQIRRRLDAQHRLPPPVDRTFSAAWWQGYADGAEGDGVR